MRKLIMAALNVSLLAACTTQPRPPGAAAAEAAAPPPALPEPVQAVLDREPDGVPATLSSSPWGGDATLVPGTAYQAASGRECRPFTLEAEGYRRPKLACRGDDGTWHEARVLTEIRP
ncbi:MAG: DVU3141 family protein [Pseudomonadota bacterium]